MHRVPEVLDCWYDSGSMPFAQWHYPFENKEIFEEVYPADFISEAIDQTRGWFYTLLAISTLLFDKASFKNCIVLGHVNDKDGIKMSKHKGNVVDPFAGEVPPERIRPGIAPIAAYIGGSRSMTVRWRLSRAAVSTPPGLLSMTWRTRL